VLSGWPRIGRVLGEVYKFVDVKEIKRTTVFSSVGSWASVLESDGNPKSVSALS